MVSLVRGLLQFLLGAFPVGNVDRCSLWWHLEQSWHKLLHSWKYASSSKYPAGLLPCSCQADIRVHYITCSGLMITSLLQVVNKLNNPSWLLRLFSHKLDASCFKNQCSNLSVWFSLSPGNFNTSTAQFVASLNADQLTTNSAGIYVYAKTTQSLMVI